MREAGDAAPADTTRHKQYMISLDLFTWIGYFSGRGERA